MAAVRHLAFLKNLKFQSLVEFWFCRESGYQILCGYLKRFESYRLLYKSKMVAIRHLVFLKNKNFKYFLNSGFVGSLDTKFGAVISNGSKVTGF